MIVRSEVIRRGAALRVHADDGSSTVVRRVDLAGTPCALRVDARRLSGTEIVGDDVELRYDDGTAETVAAAQLVPRAGPAPVD